jgi:hypothetical protein
MNTSELKYQPSREKERSKPRNMKKSLLSRVPSTSMLSAEEQELLRITLEARDEWIENSTNFEYAHDEMLIDYYTYRLKACEARYAYFIKLVKEKGLTHYI